MLKMLPFKRIKWPGWAVLILLGVIIFIGIGNSIDKSEENYKRNDQNAGFDIEIDRAIEDSDQYTMVINTPIIEEPSLDQAIQKWITKQKETFLTKVESKSDHLGSGYRAHLTIQVDARKGTNNTTSLIFNSYTLLNSVQGEDHIKTFTYNSKQKLLPLTKVLTTYETEIEDIRENIEEEFKKNDTIRRDLVDEKANKVLNATDTWSWMINKNVLTFYFDKSTLTENQTGTLEVNVPMKENEKALNTGNKYVALTFDDGPSKQVTPRVLEILKQHNAKATFFMLGSQVEKYPSLAKRVANLGHEIGNHSDHHKDLTKVKESEIVYDVHTSQQKIKDATGQSPTLVRPPYGAINSNVEKVARSNGYSLILWSVDSMDWKSKNAEAINHLVEKEVVSGSIILLHDVHASTAKALPLILSTLENEGYQFLTVSQLLAIQEEQSAGIHYGKM